MGLEIARRLIDNVWQTVEVDESAGGGGSLPAGGSTGEVLTKASNADGDADWEAAGGGSLPASAGHDEGEFLQLDGSGNPIWGGPTLPFELHAAGEDLTGFSVDAAISIDETGRMGIFPNPRTPTSPGGPQIFTVGAQDESFDAIYVWAYAPGKYGVQIVETDGHLGLWVDGTGTWIQRSDFSHGWGIAPGGHEVLVATSAPSDAEIEPGQLYQWFDATNGAAKQMRRGRTLDGTLVQLVTAIPAA